MIRMIITVLIFWSCSVNAQSDLTIYRIDDDIYSDVVYQVELNGKFTGASLKSNEPVRLRVDQGGLMRLIPVGFISGYQVEIITFEACQGCKLYLRCITGNESSQGHLDCEFVSELAAKKEIQTMKEP